MSRFFQKGRVSVIMDGGAGSSGKGLMASYMGETNDDWTFSCHSFMSNAAHTVVCDKGTFNYQCLSSTAYLTDKYEKTFICGGAVIELEPLLREIKENNLPVNKLGIHPLVAVVTQKDIDYERGVATFEGEPKPFAVNETLTLGSTLHGVGAARARRILRRKDALLARDVPELAPYICDTRDEIVSRLEKGEKGLMEIAQGYMLGYLEDKFYPKCTSRNCTVSAALDDCGIPPKFLGNVLINFRSYPIRVNSDKWLDINNKVLKYDDAQKMIANGEFVNHIKGDSGGWYPDQNEITWDEITSLSGSETKIYEKTTLTQNPRRAATFSKLNVIDAVRYNAPPEGSKIYLSINFVNYVDPLTKGKMTPKVREWLDNNIPKEHQDKLLLIGTDAHTNQVVKIGEY